MSPPHSVTFLLLVVSTGMMLGHISRPAHATLYANSVSPGDITWASSESSALQASGIAADSTGAYVVGIDNNVAGGSAFEWRIEKRDLTTGGILMNISEHISPWSDSANAVAVDSTGFYVVGSNSLTVGGSLLNEWRIEKRDLPTGSILWAQSEYIGSYEAANSVAVDNTGLYVVGYDSNNTGAFKEWRIEKRSLTTGTVIWAYSEQISSVALPEDIAYGVALDGTGLYVVGYDNNIAGNWEWRIEKRSLTDGTILWSTSEVLGAQAQAFGVAVNSMGVYVVGYDPGDPPNQQFQWRIERRDQSTGSILWAQSEHISGVGYDYAYGVAVDATGLYVVGSNEVIGPGYSEWRIEKRDLATGATLWAQSENVSGSVRGAAVDSTGVYIAGNASGWRIEKRDLGLPQTLTSTITNTTTQTNTLYSSTTTVTVTSFTSTSSSTSIVPTVTTVVLIPVSVTSTVQNTQYQTSIVTTTVTSYTSTSASTSTVPILTTITIGQPTSTIQTTQIISSTGTTTVSGLTTTTTTSYTGTLTSTSTTIIVTTVTTTSSFFGEPILVAALLGILGVAVRFGFEVDKSRIIPEVLLRVGRRCLRS